MSDDLSKSLHTLRDASEELNSLTDRANGLVRRTERFLAVDCRIGGPVHVPVESMDKEVEPDGPSWETYLGYERLKGEHRIVVTHVLDGDPREVKAWAECSRDIKLKSIDALPNLIQKLLEKIGKQVDEAHKKLSTLESMIPSESNSHGGPLGHEQD